MSIFKPRDMSDIPECNRGMIQELIDRGWIDPDTFERIEPDKYHVIKIPPLPINDEDLEKLRSMLLKLGNNDKSLEVARLYFELARRSKLNFYTEDARELFNLCKSDIEKSTAIEPLPITEEEYIRLASLLGKLAIDDSDAITDDDFKKEYGRLIPDTFLYLQDRARRGNRFALNDDLDKMEFNVNRILEKLISNTRA